MSDFLRFYYLYTQLNFEHGTTQFSSEVKAFAHASNETKYVGPMQNVNCIPENIGTLFPKMVTNLRLEKIIHCVTMLFWQFPTSPVIDYKGRLRDELLVKNLCPQLLVVTQKSPQEIFMTLTLHCTFMRFDKILSGDNFNHPSSTGISS